MIGPYHQDAEGAYRYCMIGDEPLMFRPKAELNPYQRRHVETMRYDILPWAMCFVPISRPQDVVYLDKLFLEKEAFFQWHRDMYARAGLESSTRLVFRDPDAIYAEALEARSGSELVSTVCFSHQVGDAHDVSEQLAVSKRVNSKVDLIRRAEKSGFRIPRSVLLPKSELSPASVRKHFKLPKEGLILKTDGLGGGFNVKGVEKYADIAEFSKDFAPDAPFILQEKIDRSVFSEYIADYVVRSSRVEFLATRLKLTADNKWFGNVYSPNLTFTERQVQNLERCIHDVQAQGYHAPNGYICGIDFFQSADDQKITEINGRWTGGLPVAILLKKLGLSGRVVYSHVDVLCESDIPGYRKLAEKRLYTPGRGAQVKKGDYKLFPVSFSPKVDDGKLYVWFAIIGDYAAFVRERGKNVSKDSLPLSEIVVKLAKDKKELIGA